MKSSRKGSDLHLWVQPDTLDKVDQCSDYLRDKYQTANQAIVSRSAVIRAAIDMYFNYSVKGESQIHPNDPRFSQ